MLTNKKYGLNIELKDFSQAQYEMYQDELIKHIGKSAASTNGAVVRAAKMAGFVSGLPEDIGAMPPAAVRWLTDKIHEHVMAVANPPDDPN